MKNEHITEAVRLSRAYADLNFNKSYAVFHLNKIFSWALAVWKLHIK